MTIYYTPIIFLIVATIVRIFKTDTKLEFPLLVLMAVIVSVVSGFRYYSDVDYSEYVDLYHETPLMSIDFFEDIKTVYGEPGYLFFCALVKQAGFDFYVVTLLVSIASISIKCFVAHKITKFPTLFIALYLCLYFVTVEFIELRWSIATALVFFAYYLSIKNQNFFAVIILLLSTAFHYFASVFLLILFIPIIYKTKYYILLFVLSFTIALSYKAGNYLNFNAAEIDIYAITRLMRYVNDPQSSLGFFSYLKIIGYGIVFFIYSKNKNAVSYVAILINLSLVLLSFSLLISFVPILYYRSMVISELFSLVTLVVIFSKIKNYNFRLGSIFIACCLFSLWLSFDVNNYYNSKYIFKYDSWFRFFI